MGGGDLPLRKGTRYVPNGRELLPYLQDQCRGTHGYCLNGQRHGGVSGKTAAKAAIYPQKLCRAILRGIIRQHMKDDDESDESYSDSYSGSYSEDSESSVSDLECEDDKARGGARKRWSI